MGVVHPLLIHFPISLLMLAFFLELYGLNKKGKKYKEAIPLITFLGGIGAILSALSGYILMNGGDYELSSVELHRNWGIGLAVGSALLIALYRFPPKIPFIHLIGQGLLSILVIVTGHLGGNLTHGEDFLRLNSPKKVEKETALKQEDFVYAKMVAPILEEKCISCHGKTKQKGKLKLDNIQDLLKGGKNGFYHENGVEKMSLMAHRINLPTSNKEHMPPKSKTQLTAREKVIIEKWLSLGAKNTLRLKDLKLDEILTATPIVKDADWPSVPNLAIIADARLNPLRDKGIVILPLANNHPLLQINCQSIPSFGDNDWEEFNALKQNIASLRLSGTKISDKSLKWIGEIPNLSKLYLDHTLITDEGLSYLKNAKEIRYLNLVGTSVTEKGIQSLQFLPHLKSIYLYQSEVNAESLVNLQKGMPRVYFDLGGYKIDTLMKEQKTEEK
jgi:uncharacterized membrane protein